MDALYQTKDLLSQLDTFTAYFGLVRLRPYQIEAANAVIQSVFDHAGGSFVWKFARQGGKDETLTALYEYIMTILCHRDASIVVATPTFKPQTELSMQRLQSRLARHVVLQAEWRRQSKHIFRIRGARTLFFSAHRTANVVGATASHLLVVNEAQDVSPAIYDKHFAPMAAANNATRLFSGTAWTNSTLLAREERRCRLQEEQDGIKRVFIVDGHDIAKVHAPYGEFLQGEIARLGSNNPIVLSQYLCREIDAQAGMFNPTRLALMQSDCRATRPQAEIAHSGPTRDRSYEDSPLHFVAPSPNRSADLGRAGEGSGPIINLQSKIENLTYAFLIDVAGQDESMMSSSELDNPSRDSTTLSIAEIDLSTLETLRAPTYRIVHRRAWQGLNHLTVFGQLKALVDIWKPQHIVIDATGVGEGLWALLDKAFPTRVIPVKFTQQEKSAIGWRFLAIIETGRFRDCYTAGNRDSGIGNRTTLDSRFSNPGLVNPDTVRIQYANCHSEILPGPAKTLRWGVPDGTRGPDGELVHDDHILADSLVAVLDRLSWYVPSGTVVIETPDALEAMDHAY